jgi:hypothetical protein
MLSEAFQFCKVNTSLPSGKLIVNVIMRSLIRENSPMACMREVSHHNMEWDTVEIMNDKISLPGSRTPQGNNIPAKTIRLARGEVNSSQTK